ncbi:hypothetical protein WG954_03825 [Lacibacter sp. H375]|uniref:hypothetical protein n=1 Tax=Lacibacter sp. H375 TaxID=3133424 RepID=UPI0030BE4BF1
MRILLIPLLLLFVAKKSYSQKVIPLEDINKHIGDSVTVCGKVSGVRFLETSKNTPTFINLGQAFPNHTLTIVIWSDVRKQFETVPEVLFKDKEVCVTGRIELFREKAQIVLRRKDDVFGRD